MSEAPKTHAGADTRESIDLHAYFRRRDDLRETLTQESHRMAKRLMDSIPAELAEWKDTVFFSEKNIIEWLDHLKKNSENGSYNSDKYADPQEYGFKSKVDLKRKFELLKEAWKGLIDVRVTARRGEYIRVYYTLVQK